MNFREPRNNDKNREPLKMPFESLYDVLGISSNATQAESRSISCLQPIHGKHGAVGSFWRKCTPVLSPSCLFTKISTTVFRVMGVQQNNQKT
jgi:hypothetical protein